MKNPNDEKAMLKACLKGDLKAQRCFYNRFANKMMGVCWRFAKSREEAEDLLQEGFFKVFCDLPRYRGEGSLEGWVRQVIVNVALQHVRKRKLLFQSVSENDLGNLQDKSHEQLFQQFEVADLLKMLHILPEGCRVIFNLFVLEGFSHKEIAEELKITTGTSKSQLAKARMLLKEQVKKIQILI